MTAIAKSTLLTLLISSLAMPAAAQVKGDITDPRPLPGLFRQGDWREEVENMTPQEREHFYEVRRGIQNDVKSMSEEERREFRKHLKVYKDDYEDTVQYVEQPPQPTKEMNEAEAIKAIKAKPWKERSYEEKRRLMQYQQQMAAEQAPPAEAE